MAEKTGVKIKSRIPKKLVGRNNISAYSEEVKKLTNVAGELTSSGLLVVALFEGGEVYDKTTQLIRDLLDLDSFYSLKAIQNNPKLADEYKEIAIKIKEIEAIIEKRRKAVFSNKKPKAKETKGE